LRGRREKQKRFTASARPIATVLLAPAIDPDSVQQPPSPSARPVRMQRIGRRNPSLKHEIVFDIQVDSVELLKTRPSRSRSKAPAHG